MKNKINKNNDNVKGGFPFVSMACNMGSIGLAWAFLFQLPADSRITLQRGLLLTSLGFFYFVSLTDFFNKFLLETSNGLKIRKKFRLKFSDVLEITNKLVSTVQALLCSVAGAFVCKYSCKRSFLHASHYVSEAYAWFGTAYFIYDIWSMYKVHAATTAYKMAEKLKSSAVSLKNSGLYDKLQTNGNAIGGAVQKEHFEKNRKIWEYDSSSIQLTGLGFVKYMLTHPVMMIHHIFIGSFGLAVIVFLRGGLGDCIFSFMYMMEISTPFVSLRSMLSKMNLKESRIYLINGLLMIVTFFIFRILMLPYIFYWYSEVINKPFFVSINGLPRSCRIGMCILFLPQYYWFYLMIRGAIKAFSPKTKKSSIQNGKSEIKSSTKINGVKNNHKKNVTNGHSRSLL